MLSHEREAYKLFYDDGEGRRKILLLKAAFPRICEKELGRVLYMAWRIQRREPTVDGTGHCMYVSYGYVRNRRNHYQSRARAQSTVAH